MIALSIRQTEIKILRENPPRISSASVVLPDIDDQRKLACFFSWFATSLSNYVGLTRYIMGISEKKIDPSKHQEQSKKLGDYFKEYSSEVILSVDIWRNKVAGHFARVFPFKDDNIATLTASIMYPVNYRRPYLEAGGFRYTEGNLISEIPCWQLTKVFEDLAQRYWEDISLPSLV